MKTPGAIRKIDDLGRIVIPFEMRKALKMEKGDMLEIYLEDESLVMKKFVLSCIFCGETQGLRTYEGKKICTKCIQIIKDA